MLQVVIIAQMLSTGRDLCCDILCTYRQEHTHTGITWITEYFSQTTTTTVLWPCFPGPPGWAGAKRELLDFMVQREINRGRHTDHPAGCHSIRTNQCPPPPSPHIFYGLDSLPAAQPTVSKYWRQLAHSGEDARVLLNSVTCTVFIP